MREQSKPRQWIAAVNSKDLRPVTETADSLSSAETIVIEKSAFDALSVRCENAEAHLDSLQGEMEIEQEKYAVLKSRCAELEAQVKENELMGCSPYCPTCGSCGEDGCCPVQMCKYPDIKSEVVTKLKEDAERDYREIESLRAELSEKEREIERLHQKTYDIDDLYKAALRELAEVKSDYWYRKAKGAETVAQENKQIYKMLEASEAKIAELEKQLAEKDAELKDLVRLQAGEFYLVHHKSHPDPAEEFVKAFNALREDWVSMKAALESTASTGCYHCSGDASETLANLKYKGE